MNSMVVSSCSLSPPPCCFFLSACKRKLSSVFLFLFPLEEEKKEEEEEESNLLLMVVAVVILFFDVATSPVSSTVADVRIDIVRNDDSDARVQTEEVTKDDDDDEAKFRRSFSTSSLRGIRRRILCEDDKSFDAPLKLTDAAFLRIFFDAPVFCTRQALVCADLDDVGQDEDMICFFVLTHKSCGSDLSVVSRSRFLLCFNCYYYYYYYPPLFSLRTSRRKGKE